MIAAGLAVAGCGGGAGPTSAPAKGPEAKPAPAASTPQTPPPPEAKVEIPPAPETCAAYPAARSASKSCKDARGELARALGKPPQERDAALALLEACSELPSGVVRALRIELLPAECGDALALPWMEQAPNGQRADVSDALRGLALAAQASRLVRRPPRLEPPMSKARVVEFMKGPLMSWIQREVAAIHHVSTAGAALDGYGKAVVAVEAGLADMRFVEIMRQAPVPDEIKQDRELSEVYYASLDEALEPRKVRGRDAALVGMGKLAEVGVISDPRVERARALLSAVYSGRRIDALDGLLLPPLSAFQPRNVEDRIASSVPTFYLPLLLPDLDAKRPALLRAAIERGLPQSARAALDSAKLPAETERLYARALFDLGRTYWRASDFSKSAEVAARQKTAPDMALVRALGSLLAKGPKHAADMILGGPHLPSSLGQVAALDQMGAQHPSLRGYAAYDAAFLLELARPPGADAKYFEDIAKRYADAQRHLPAADRARAAERRKAAADTAKAIPNKP